LIRIKSQSDGGSFATARFVVAWFLILIGFFRCLNMIYPDTYQYNSSEFVFNLGMIAVGIIALLYYTGIEIDPERMAYRRFYFVAGVRTGTWLELENPVRVLLAPHTHKFYNRRNWHTTVSRNAYKVGIFSEKPHALIMGFINNRDKALQTAEEIAAELNLKLDNRIE
jgi:hypothetical protein